MLIGGSVRAPRPAASALQRQRTTAWPGAGGSGAQRSSRRSPDPLGRPLARHDRDERHQDAEAGEHAGDGQVVERRREGDAPNHSAPIATTGNAMRAMTFQTPVTITEVEVARRENPHDRQMA